MRYIITSQKTYRITSKVPGRFPGLGDEIMTLRVVCAIRNLGIDALYKPSRKSLISLMDPTTPFTNTANMLVVRRDIPMPKPIRAKTPAIDQISDRFKAMTGIDVDSIKLPYQILPAPTAHKQIDVPSYNIVMTTKCGGPTWKRGQNRNWPKFDKLKSTLSRRKISWCDITNEKDHKFLSYVDRAKVYLSIDTGQPHLASKVGAGKTLIIQSGVTSFPFWAKGYDFEFVNHNVPCQYCWGKRGFCQSHQCMKLISIDEIMSWILSRL